MNDAQLILTCGQTHGELSEQTAGSQGGKAELLKVGDHFSSLTMKPDEGEIGADNTGMIEDPHWWHSVANVKQATKIIRDELIRLDPADKADFEKNAKLISRNSMRSNQLGKTQSG